MIDTIIKFAKSRGNGMVPLDDPETAAALADAITQAAAETAAGDAAEKPRRRRSKPDPSAESKSDGDPKPDPDGTDEPEPNAEADVKPEAAPQA
jgi:hypothetical protein